MSRYIPRRKIIKEIQKRQELHQQWLSHFMLIKQNMYKLGGYIYKKVTTIHLSPLHTNTLKGMAIKYTIKQFLGCYNTFLGYIKNSNSLKKCLAAIQKRVYDFRQHLPPVGKIGWKYRFYILFICILSFTVNNILSTGNVYKKYGEIAPVRNINLFPTLPISWLKLSQLYFLHNQEEDAKNALAQAKKYFYYYPALINFSLFGKEIKNTEKMLNYPQQRRAQLLENEALLKQYPYSWQLWAIKAKHEKELYFQEQFYNSISRLEWLYPRNEISPQLTR